MAKRMMKSKLPVTQVLGVVAGSIAAGLVTKLVGKFMPSASPVIKALVPVGAGVFLAMNKNEILKGAGFGMVAAGGSSLVEAFMPGMLSGPDVDSYFLGEADDYITAPADQSVLSGPADQSVLAGYEEDFMNGDEEMMGAYSSEEENY